MSHTRGGRGFEICDLIGFFPVEHFVLVRTAQEGDRLRVGLKLRSAGCSCSSNGCKVAPPLSDMCAKVMDGWRAFQRT